jgi:CBS domain containing-hemolysin-like protein
VNPGALLAAALLIVANAFFVAVEFAVVASRRTKIEPLAAQGSRPARAALAAMQDLNTQLAGAQLGITMASLLLGYVGEPAVAHLIAAPLEALFDPPEAVVHAISLVIALGIVVFLHMVLGEMVPKNLAITEPERVLMILALPNQLYVSLFRPIIWLLNAMANGLVRLTGVEPRSELASVHTAEEFAAMLAHSREEGLIEPFEHDLLTGVLDFRDRPVSAVMVPRDRMVTMPAGATVEVVEALAVESGHSRLPVVGDDADRPFGFVHAKDLLSLSAAAYRRAVPDRLIRRMLRVPPERTLGDLMVSMRAARVHVAVVVDDDGRTVGLVTLEDLLEELVGDIRDESDPRE